MSRCKLIVNKLSGNAHKVASLEDVNGLLREKYDEVDVVYIDPEHDIKMSEEVEGYDGLAVCGGDGTLNSAINAISGKNIDLTYIPCGTFNDAARSLRLAKKLRKGDRRIRRVDMGQIDNTMFAYVLAGGIFSPIGYKTKNSHKQRFKIFAYLAQVLKEYKINRIRAKITLTEDRILEDEYTLIMVINSRRCFGFPFNKIYRHNDGRAQLLLIKAPESDGLLGKIKVFFPLFRAFFIGFRSDYDHKNLKFLTIDQAFLELESETEFTVDGEKLLLKGGNYVKILRQKLNLVVY